ncbi:MAG: ribokinase [Metallosphaera yellowstonensis]
MINVVGSYNVDLTLKVSKFPIPGETVFVDEFMTGHGGKGSNQAVSAARLRSKVKFVGAVGRDHHGDRAMEFLKEEGVDTRCVKRKDAPTGTAYIILDGNGETIIMVNRGANYLLAPNDIEGCMDGDILLTQMEIREEVVKTALSTFPGLRILNPAPAVITDQNLLSYVDILTPNEVEFKEISSSDDLSHGAEVLLKRVKKAIIVTLGEHGAVIFTKHRSVRIPAPKVDAIDTTGAGDVFNAALAVFLEKGYDIEEAVEKANIIAAASVKTYGALGPRWEEVEDLLKED